MQPLAFVGFEWDAGNRLKCQKHGLPLREVEHVLAHGSALVRQDDGHSGAEPRYLAIGRTSRGRYAFVVFTPRAAASGQNLVATDQRPVHARQGGPEI
jgi:uncharacterized DUF497 family protein